MKITAHMELMVFQQAVDAAMSVYEKTKRFPKEETYSLTDQIRRSSRSVAANIAEAWRKRRYTAAFIAKISDAETEAAETQVWLDFALRCGYLASEDEEALRCAYDQVLRTLVGMIKFHDRWTFNQTDK